MMLTASSRASILQHVGDASPADLGRSERFRRIGATICDMGAFFVPGRRIHGGCAWDTFGCAGFLKCRSANPRTVVSIRCLAASGDGSKTSGARPMKLHTPRASARRAAAHRAMAMAALRADSSLSVRLKRYRQHMDKARALEAQGQEARHG